MCSSLLYKKFLGDWSSTSVLFMMVVTSNTHVLLKWWWMVTWYFHIKSRNESFIFFLAGWWWCDAMQQSKIHMLHCYDVITIPIVILIMIQCSFDGFKNNRLKKDKWLKGLMLNFSTWEKLACVKVNCSKFYREKMFIFRK